MRNRPIRMTPAAIAALMILSGVYAPANIARADDAGVKLQDQMIGAYKETKTYESSVAVELKSSASPGKFQNAQYKVDFDRTSNQLLIDRPDVVVVVDKDTILARSDQVRGKYMKVDAPSPITYDTLSELVPFVRSGQHPDVASLISADPFMQIVGELVANPKFLDPDESKRPGLETNIDGMLTTLRLDPATHLITQVIREVKGRRDGEVLTVTYKIDIKKRNQPLEGTPFAFDTRQSTAALSYKEWVKDVGTETGVHPLEGKDAPQIALDTLDGKKFKLSEVKPTVVVLDFWATWCRPCVLALPKVASIQDWADKEKLSVVVYTVNLSDTPDEVQAFLKKHEIKAPILMDVKGDVGQAYHVSNIPMTVVIANGKVVKVHIGYSETMDAELKADIQKALVMDSPATPAAPR